MKRFASIFFALYIAFAACFPCSDGDACADDMREDSSITIVSPQEHAAEEVDLCSPFCICSCCSASIQQPKYFVFEFHRSITSDLFFFVKPQATQSVAYSVWQPPKLS
ncbi:DUF6660 family protein [Pseudochryseolinea flava]|uniref:DUF6660 family protein n=1 Tax=Pseudochryseolinea flava TaxID=2059302 RepID=UPI0037431EB1